MSESSRSRRSTRSRVYTPTTDYVNYARRAMELLVLALVTLSPWAFGGVDPVFEFIMAIGISGILVLWLAIAILNGRLSVFRCPVTVVLCGIVILGLFQLIPLPTGLLRLISPGTVSVHEEFIPAVAERLTDTESLSGRLSWLPITVYAHVTRAEVFRWLCVVILFLAVRNQIATTDSMRRLAIVLLVNGALLTIVGLAQSLSGGTVKKIFWTYETTGAAFGPFVNRNHFATYINICIGLGIGLLGTLGLSEEERRRTYMVKTNAINEQNDLLSTIFSPLSILHSPAQLWTVVALAVMGGGLIACLSRGGVASLIVAGILALGLRATLPLKVHRLELIGIPIVLVIGFLAWLGIKPLETRLGSLWQGDAYTDGRWGMWANLINLFPKFPIFGSGYGTLGYIEPLSRPLDDQLAAADLFIDHAHNDYLEALLEGGVIRLGLTIALTALVLVIGYRALRRYANRTPAAWALGGLIATIAVVLHSFVDFSLTTPAVGILAAVVAAQLISLNRSDPTVPISAAHSHVLTASLNTPGRFALGGVGALLAILIVSHFWLADRVYRLRLGAFQAVKKIQPPDYTEGISFLEAAAKTDPSDANIQLELGQTLLDARNAVSQRADKQQQILEEYVLPGLRHLAMARQLCPLLARPHVRFASHTAKMVQADPPALYWERARKLSPADPDLWYYSGVQQLQEQHPEQAWPFWRNSLDLSNRHLNEIIDRALPRLGENPQDRIHGLMEKILPPEGVIHFEAAKRIDNDLTPDGPVKPLLEEAVKLLEERKYALTPNEMYVLARSYHALGQIGKATSMYRQAIAQERRRPEWRRDYVSMLIDQEKWNDAARELPELMQQMPSEEVKGWFNRVTREMQNALPR